MSTTREVLRLRLSAQRSVRQTALAVGVSRSVVSKMTCKAAAAELSWEVAETLDDTELERRLYGIRTKTDNRAEPDPRLLHQEYKRPGVTLQLLHHEYLQEHPEGLGYTAFCSRYTNWLKKRGLSMRQLHRAGEKAFVDYSGKRPHYIDRETGEKVYAEFFIEVLGASNYTFAEATPSQQLVHWIGSNTRALEFFGGVPEALVPDQLKSAVTISGAYEPGVQRTYAELGKHYDTVIFPARPRKPKDKAKAEVAVQIAQRWILARMRNETFFSIEELNVRIGELLAELNDRPMKKLGGVSRRELFERYEKNALRPLPVERFEPATWKKVKVNTDYHVKFEDHWYSVPYTLRHEEVWLRVTEKTVEILHCNRRVAGHVRSAEPYKSTTNRPHRPAEHQAWADADPATLLTWAEKVGPTTASLMTKIVSRSPFREQAWRAGLGLKKLGDNYEHERIEAASERALCCGATSYHSVERMLKLGLENEPLPGEQEPDEPGMGEHENIRGADYYLN